MSQPLAAVPGSGPQPAATPKSVSSGWPSLRTARPANRRSSSTSRDAHLEGQLAALQPLGLDAEQLVAPALQGRMSGSPRRRCAPVIRIGDQARRHLVAGGAGLEQHPQQLDSASFSAGRPVPSRSGGTVLGSRARPRLTASTISLARWPTWRSLRSACAGPASWRSLRRRVVGDVVERLVAQDAVARHVLRLRRRSRQAASSISTASPLRFLTRSLRRRHASSGSAS